MLHGHGTVGWPITPWRSWRGRSRRGGAPVSRGRTGRRHDREVLPRGGVDGGAHQETADALALELVGHLGVIGDHDHHVAELGTTGCVLGIAATTYDGVKAIVERARNAGATVATEPAPQP
jgi:hypothetical protein